MAVYRHLAEGSQTLGGPAALRQPGSWGEQPDMSRASGPALSERTDNHHHNDDDHQQRRHFVRHPVEALGPPVVVLQKIAPPAEGPGVELIEQNAGQLAVAVGLALRSFENL